MTLQPLDGIAPQTFSHRGHTFRLVWSSSGFSFATPLIEVERRFLWWSYWSTFIDMEVHPHYPLRQLDLMQLDSEQQAAITEECIHFFKKQCEISLPLTPA